MGLEEENTGLAGRIRTWLTTSRRFEPTCESLAWLAVAVGLTLRAWEYLEFRQLYMDESALLENLTGRAVFDFQQVLSQDQLAPPGFLVVERLMVRLPISVMASGRVFPLFCGLASVFLMRRVSWKYLDRLAVPFAIALFALADHLIYYSGEIKQYSCDLALTLGALVLAAPPPPEELTNRQFTRLTVFGLIAPWFSFPIALVLAGVGLHLIVSRAIRREWRKSAAAVAMSLAWLVSFAGCFMLSRSIMSKGRFLWDWWDFAFLPIPPRSFAEVGHIAETLANVFINPGSVLTPLELPHTALLASSLALLGGWSLGRRWLGGLFLVLAPLLFALTGSALRQYPFHGRLLLFLVPTYLLLMAEGAAWIGRRTGPLVAIALMLFLLYAPVAEIAWQKTIIRRYRPFDTHGDLKSDLLDYLDGQRNPPRVRFGPSKPGSEGMPKAPLN